MKRIFSIFVIYFIGFAFAYSADTWKPEPSEVIEVDDPRNAVLDAYRQAISITQVQTYLTQQQDTPGDKEDDLITEFQEAVSGRVLTQASEYLKTILMNVSPIHYWFSRSR